MKVVKLSHPNYEYDVHSLVKAFYAEDQVTVITPETKPEKLAELEPQVSLEIELAETGAKIRVGEEDFLWDAEMETIADGYKNGLKRFLYRTLSKVTGQKLPWGNLTGIRPTKIAYGMLDEGIEAGVVAEPSGGCRGHRRTVAHRLPATPVTVARFDSVEIFLDFSVQSEESFAAVEQPGAEAVGQSPEMSHGTTRGSPADTKEGQYYADKGKPFKFNFAE